MPVTLCTSPRAPRAGKNRLPWCCLPGSGDGHGLDPDLELQNLATRLELSFDAIRDALWDLGRNLGAGPSAYLAHTPTCTTYGSDLALILAWSDLVGRLAASPDPVLAVCDDPWIYRHLATLPGVTSESPPPLIGTQIKAWLRGYTARTAYSVKALRSWWKTRNLRCNHDLGAAVIVVFGHPTSTADGIDAYFADLMIQLPELRRLMHTDCSSVRALELAQDGRTASLHAWGNPLAALALPWAKWRPTTQDIQGPFAWLVRRAAVHEGAGAAGASQAWQDVCQRRWLIDRKPHTIAWPWENHPWERNMVHAARQGRVRTIGYQHTVVGRHMYNQSPATNVDGITGLPDAILCNGPAYRDQLQSWGIPAGRLAIGGALRVAMNKPLRHDPHGPIFVALSHDMDISKQMIEAVAQAQENGQVFLIKEHPMYPCPFTETATLQRTRIPLPEHNNLAGVLFATGTVGLEGILGGLPTLRFLPEGVVAMHITPPGIEPVNVDKHSLLAALQHLTTPPVHAWDTVFAPPDMAVWRCYLDRKAV